MAAFNFTRRPAGLSATVDRLLELADAPDAPAIFLESMSGQAYLPEFAAAHRMPLLDAGAEPRIWIGNAVKVNTHFDLAYNIACVAGGRRRFTLFPPEQVANLYIAPLDFTPSGAPVSLVQLTNPDHARFPRLCRSTAPRAAGGARTRRRVVHSLRLVAPRRIADAIQRAGELLVERRARLRRAPRRVAARAAHASAICRADQRAVWAELFQQLVFTDPEQALAHLPATQRGMLAPPSAERTRQIREKLAKDLGRPP